MLNRGVEALSGNSIVKINCDPSKVVNKPAQSEAPSGKSHQNERGKLIRASDPTQIVHRALPLKTKPTEMKALTKHWHPRMKEECQRIVTDYDLQPKLDAATRLRHIIHQEVEDLAFQSARKLPINLPSGVRARTATPT